MLRVEHMRLLLYGYYSGLARNMQALQVIFLQNLQDLALNLARLALKMKLLLQEIKSKNLQERLQDRFLARFDSFIFSTSLARLSARSCKFSKILLARIAYFLSRLFLLDNTGRQSSVLNFRLKICIV